MNNKRFSNASKTYDLHAAPQKQLARTIVDFLPILENPSILEIGSGTGVLTRKLQEKFPNSKIHAIDIADKMIEFCKSEFSQFNNITWQVADGQFYQNSHLYDLIASNATLHWTSNLSHTLSTIYTNLKPGGLFILGMMLNDTLSELRNLRKHIAPKKGDGPILPTKKDIDRQISSIGFNIIKENHNHRKVQYSNTQVFLKTIHQQGVTALQRNDLPLNRSELLQLINCYQKVNSDDNGVYATYETAGYLLKKPIV